MPGLAGDLYRLADDALNSPRRARVWAVGQSPAAVLRRSVEILQLLLVQLWQFRAAADQYRERCQSAAYTRFFDQIDAELTDQYLATVEDHLRRMQLPNGVFLTARLGPGGHGRGYVLRRPESTRRDWKEWLLGDGPVQYTYRIPDRDDAGARALGELQDEGINLVADAVALSVDHITDYFTQLRWQAGFHLAAGGLPHRAAAPQPSRVLARTGGHHGRGVERQDARAAAKTRSPGI